MEEIIEDLEHQDTLLKIELKKCKNKERKELLKLAIMAVNEASSYLYEIEDLTSDDA